MSHRPRLIIMQGKPGCGKSTVAAAIEHYATDTDACKGWPLGRTETVSADTYLWLDGKYVWTEERQATAHKMAEAKADSLMRDKVPLIIIDNTNLKYEWAEHYFHSAFRHGYDIQVIRVDAQWHLQVEQNDERIGGRHVSIEPYRTFIEEDLLSELYGLSYSRRWRVLWSSLRAVFLLKQGKVLTTGSRRRILSKR